MTLYRQDDFCRGKLARALVKLAEDREQRPIPRRRTGPGSEDNRQPGCRCLWPFRFEFFHPDLRRTDFNCRTWMSGGLDRKLGFIPTPLAENCVAISGNPQPRSSRPKKLAEHLGYVGDHEVRPPLIRRLQQLGAREGAGRKTVRAWRTPGHVSCIFEQNLSTDIMASGKLSKAR